MEQNLDHHFSAESIFSEEKCQERITALTRLLHSPDEENLWNAIILFQGYPFRTVSGLPFSYTIKIGKNGQLTKELLINRRENSKSLTWSSICLAYKKSTTYRWSCCPAQKAWRYQRNLLYLSDSLAIWDHKSTWIFQKSYGQRNAGEHFFFLFIW